MSYDLNGRKLLILINVQNYSDGRDRIGANIDEKNIIKTFEDRV